MVRDLISRWVFGWLDRRREARNLKNRSQVDSVIVLCVMCGADISLNGVQLPDKNLVCSKKCELEWIRENGFEDLGQFQVYRNDKIVRRTK